MNPDEKKGNENNRKGNDPFKEMIEEMMRDIDRMMKENFQGTPFEEMNPNPNTDITFSFSFEPRSQEPQTITLNSNDQREENVTDIIDKEDETIIVLEIPGKREGDIKTYLEEGKIKIRGPGVMKEIPLPGKSNEIKEKTYKNDVLEIKISKKD